MDEDQRSPLADLSTSRILLLLLGGLTIVFGSIWVAIYVHLSIPNWELPGAAVCLLCAACFMVFGWRIASDRPHPKLGRIGLCALPAILCTALSTTLFAVHGWILVASPVFMLMILLISIGASFLISGL